jgi:hypothetical protein
VKGKRPYRIDPAVAHARAVKASHASRTPEVYIRALGRASLTDAHKRQIAALIMPFLAGQAGDGGEGEAA